MSSESPSNETPEKNLPNFNGIWKWGKYLQAKAFKDQINLPMINAKRGPQRYPSDSKGEVSDNEMGDIANIDSPQYHYHMPSPNQGTRQTQQPGLLKKGLVTAAALALGTSPVALGAWWLAGKLSEKPAVVQPVEPVTAEPTERVIKEDWELGTPFFGKPE